MLQGERGPEVSRIIAVDFSAASPGTASPAPALFEEPNTVEALRNHSAPAHVVSHGAVLDLERMAALAAG